MPKWISVEEAAAKYGINKEVIWLWADMKRFPMSYEKVSPLLMKKALSDSCIRIRIELQPSISTHWKTYVLKKQISVTYMLKLLVVKTKNSCIKGSKSLE